MELEAGDWRLETGDSPPHTIVTRNPTTKGKRKQGAGLTSDCGRVVGGRRLWIEA